MAAEAGAAFVGLVGAMPSGPGPIPDHRIAAIAARVPAGVTAVLLSSRTRAADLARHAEDTGVAALQIVQTVPPSVRRELRDRAPDLTLIQVVHVEGPGSVEEALQAAEASDYLLLDSGRPSAPVPELGGTGRTHDWSLSTEIVARSPVPVFLAGGLGPSNVREAITQVSPFGVDLCSGLRDSEGRLERGLLRAFVDRVSQAWESTGRP